MSTPAAATAPAAPVTPVAAPAAAPAPSVAPAAHAAGPADGRNDLGPRPSASRKPRRLGQPSSAQVTGVPPALTLVANVPFFTNRRMTPNTFVPSSIALYAMLDAMDSMMRTTHRFLQSTPVWCPWISQIYIGILFIIQTLRAQRELGTTTPSQEELLRDFEQHYDFRNLVIPGPLVPFFQALSCFSAPFEWFNDVSPALPSTPPSWNDASDWLLGNGLSHVLPNIPLIMDCLIQLQNSPPLANQSFVHDFLQNVMSVALTNNNNIAHHFRTPGAQNDWRMTTSQFNLVIEQLGFITFPPRLNAATNAGGTFQWVHFLRLIGTDGNYYAWFPTIAQTMATYSHFFRNSVPLSAISPVGLAAGLPKWQIQANARLTGAIVRTTLGTAPNNSISVRVAPLTNLPVIGKHGDVDLEEIAEQYSALSLVNVSFAGLASANQAFPTEAQLRTGPIWQMMNHRTSPTVDSVPGYGTVIANYYHTTTALTPI